MDDQDGAPSVPNPDPPADRRSEREGRLAKALRENLRRRKALQTAPDDRPDQD